jgi:CubicO group peptidase (beta-lactamase class C family)
MDMDGGVERVAELIGKIVRTEGVHGAGIAVRWRGDVVLEEYAGIARPGKTAGPDTLWPVASITKLYTATAIMRLIEMGELALIMRTRSVLPRLAGGGKEEITLRQLLTHTSGFVYESPNMPQLLAQQVSLAEIVDDTYDLPLQFPPGTDQLYSDLGYGLAGRVAAVAMQDEFHDLVRELVLEPAGLTDTFFQPPASEHGRIANITGAANEGTPGAMYNSAYARGLAHPAFGEVATLRDLLAFGTLFTPHAERRLLSNAGLRTMTSDQTCGDEPGERVYPPAGIIHPWGIGFMLKGRAGVMELVAPSSFGHGGATGCVLWIDPVQDVVIAFVSNRHYGADPDRFMPRIHRVVNAVTASLA